MVVVVVVVVMVVVVVVVGIVVGSWLVSQLFVFYAKQAGTFISSCNDNRNIGSNTSGNSSSLRRSYSSRRRNSILMKDVDARI